MEFDIDISSDLVGSPGRIDGFQPAGKATKEEPWVFSSIHDLPTVKAPPFQPCTGKKKQRRVAYELSSSESSDIEPEDCESSDCEWQVDHPSIGKKVVRYFLLEGKTEAFVGQVISYLPPSSVSAKDQLYKIEYDDEDTEDLDQMEYEQAREAFRDKYAVVRLV